MQHIRITLIQMTILCVFVSAQTPGYFKDIFSDGGAYLTSMTNMPAADALSLSVEYLYTSDVDVQNGVITGDDMDSNGHLLYPDGAPRFRMIYTNGGSATNHGNSLDESGRDRVRTFYVNGGSYSGSCAGAFIVSLHYASTGTYIPYYHIWPGRATETGLLDAYTGHFIPEGSALLNYFDFGRDQYIDDVRHNGGCYANEQIDYPLGTEVLLRYDCPGWDMHEQPSTWAYKPRGNLGLGVGRIVVTGSHPEFVESGERLDLMQAILLYALDGCGLSVIKADLNNAETRSMDLFSEDSLPAFTRIGDKQYHHFTISAPAEANTLTVVLSAEPGYDFNLYANPDGFAFENSARFVSMLEGPDHILEIPIERSGLWYIGVECVSTVESLNYLYYGDTEVLNGVAYDISATCDTSSTTSTIQTLTSIPQDYRLLQNYPNPFNPSTSIRYEIPEQSIMTLTIYDVLGHEIIRLADGPQAPRFYSLQWDGVDQTGNSVSTGIYFCRIVSSEYSKTVKMMYLE